MYWLASRCLCRQFKWGIMWTKWWSCVRSCLFKPINAILLRVKIHRLWQTQPSRIKWNGKSKKISEYFYYNWNCHWGWLIFPLTAWLKKFLLWYKRNTSNLKAFDFVMPGPVFLKNTFCTTSIYHSHVRVKFKCFVFETVEVV